MVLSVSWICLLHPKKKNKAITNKDFIYNARRVRKVFGGGMRQAGIIAAGGLFALKNNINRLKTDHKHAKLIEEGEPYYFACFLSAANTAETRKNVHMQAVERLHESIESIHSASVMVSHADFCEHEAKWSSLIYQVKDGSGWKVPTMYVNSGDQFTWAVFTSDHPNTPEQIDLALTR